MVKQISIITLLVICCCCCCVSHGQIRFDGTNDYIAIGRMPSTSVFTVSFVIKRDAANLRPAYNSDNILKFAAVNVGRMSISYLSNPGWFQVWPNTVNSAGYAIGMPLASNIFHACAVVSSTGGVFAYADGVCVGTVSVDKVAWNLGTVSNISSTWSSTDEPGTGNYYYSGILEDMRIYSRAFSASEVCELFLRPWAFASDASLLHRSCIVTNDTGVALTGTARNYGTGAAGTYSNSPIVAQPHVQTEKPLTMELP